MCMCVCVRVCLCICVCRCMIVRMIVKECCGFGIKIVHKCISLFISVSLCLFI